MATLEMPRLETDSVRRSSGENGDGKINNSGKVDKECRICHLSLYGSSPSGSLSSSGAAIELGCSCKDDLAAAHKHCADTWFKIKGNKTCEICNSIAENVTAGPSYDIEAGEVSDIESRPSDSGAGRRCLNGHRFLNFVLACMVFAFACSWLFHVNIPS